jgi:osmoprotectant transport system substrate-binding protein
MYASWGCGQARSCRRFRVRRPLALLVASAVLAACGGGGGSAAPTGPQLNDDVITVGSFDFAESVVVAEVYSQAIEAAGFKVRRAFELGPREFVGPALSAGLVEFVAEYAGTASEFYSVGRAAPSDDVVATHTELERAIDGQPLVALAAAPAQDANTFVVTKATADRLHLKFLSDLQPVAGQLKFGGPPECFSRQLCLAGLAATYGLKFDDVLTLDAGGPLTHQALKEGLVDVALMFTTDATMTEEGLVELDDDRGLQPAESITPLLRSEVVEQLGPDLVKAIDAVSAKLTTAAVRDLNGRLAVSGADAASVASAWLSEVQQ